MTIRLLSGRVLLSLVCVSIRRDPAATGVFMDTIWTARAATAPNLGLARIAGLTMIASAVFVIVGDDPVIQDVFGTSDKELKLQYILAEPDAWDRAMTMYAIAAAVVALGFVLWAAAVKLGRSDTSACRIAALGAGLATIGGLTWVYVSYARATHPPEDVAQDQNIVWWASAFAVLVAAAIALIGLLFLGSDMRKRGWALIVVAVVFVPVGLILPLLVPFAAALTGVIILATTSTHWESTLNSAVADAA
jgi:hypothetical protein